MKFKDVFENFDSDVNEAPMGMFSRGLANIGSIVPGNTGIVNKGKLDVGDVANKLYNLFYQYVGRSNLPVTGNSIKRFLQTNNLDLSIDRFMPSVDTSNPLSGLPGFRGSNALDKRLSNSRVEKIFLGMVQDRAAGNPLSQPDTSTDSDPTQSTPTPTPSATPTPASNPPPTPTPSPDPMGNRSFLNSLRYLSGSNLDRVRDMLTRRSAMIPESTELDEIDFQRLKKKSMKAAKAAGKGISNFGKGASFGYKDPTRAATLRRNPNTGMMTKAGRLTGRAANAGVDIGGKAARAGLDIGNRAVRAAGRTGADLGGKALRATGSALKATPGAIAGAAGAIGSAGTNIRNAYQSSRGSSMTPNEMEHMIATLEPSQAKQVLDYINTIHP